MIQTMKCRRLLAGRLLGKGEIKPNHLIQLKGPQIICEPLVKEIDSTAFASRVVALRSLPDLTLIKQASRLSDIKETVDLLDSHLETINDISNSTILLSLDKCTEILIEHQ